MKNEELTSLIYALANLMEAANRVKNQDLQNLVTQKIEKIMKEYI